MPNASSVLICQDGGEQNRPVAINKGKVIFAGWTVRSLFPYTGI